MSLSSLKMGQWKGQPAYVVGGGPSLSGFDWSLLAGRRNVVAINGAIKTCPWASFFFTEDLRVIELYHKSPEWHTFQGVKVFHALKPSFAARALELDSSIQIIDRKREDKFWSRSFEDGLSISSNSGVGALNLVHLLGADPIYLLGFDCRGLNFHKDYERAGFDQMGPFQHQTYLSDFKYWVAPQMRDRRIVNLTTREHKSAIECWPRMDRDSMLVTGRPSWIDVHFTRQAELRFDFIEGDRGVERVEPLRVPV